MRHLPQYTSSLDAKTTSWRIQALVNQSLSNRASMSAQTGSSFGGLFKPAHDTGPSGSPLGHDSGLDASVVICTSASMALWLSAASFPIQALTIVAFLNISLIRRS